jgi:ABC-type lipoprotein release transport system permease subunit
MAAWWLWVRTDARRRLRPALVLMVLVALAGGVILAAVAGGRRNGTAVERAAALTSPAQALVLLNQPGFDWDTVRALPEVEAVAEFPVSGYTIEGFPEDLSTGFPAGSPEAMTEVEVPVVVEGRLPDPERIEEVIVSPEMARQGVEVGDQLTLEMLTPEATVAWLTGEEPAEVEGPHQEVTVVGVAKGSFFADGVQTTYAFFDHYRANLSPPELYVNAVVRLRQGAADLPAFQADMVELAGRPVEMQDATVELKRTSNATHLERDALYAFAAAAALAALLLVGQAVVRMVASSASEVPLLRALGFTRGGAAVAMAALPATAAAVGAIAAGGVAYLLSDRFPIGVGRQAEPHPGFHADWAVIGPGVTLTAALAMAGTLALAWLALRPHHLAAAPAGSRVAGAVAASNAPVPLALGVRLALVRGDGRTAVPVRPALVGAVVGVLGVVAALTFGTGLDRATTDDALYGQSFDATIVLVGGSTDILPEGLIDALADRPEVEMVTAARNAVVQIEGRDVSVTGTRELAGDLDLRAVRGQLPTARDEIALAPQDMDALEVEVGDEVRVEGASEPFSVTAEAFSPEFSHTAYDAGGQMTDEGLRRLVPSEDDLKFLAHLVRFTPESDVAATVDRLNEELTLGALEAQTPIADQENLKGVRQVPLALGAFLAVLAVGAVGHALASTVRRRRHDVAVLRVLGLTRRQARATVAWQATTLAFVGLAFGLPLGIAAGRVIWRIVAEGTPMLYVAPFAAVALVLVPPAAIALANVLAAWPGHLAARLRPAESLRTE